MTIKIKGRDVYRAFNSTVANETVHGLKRYADGPIAGNGSRPPAAVAFRIAMAIKELQRVYEPIEEQRNKLISELGNDDEDGRKTISPESENMGKFLEEMEDLLAEEIEINARPVVVNDLDEPPSVDTLLSFHYLFEEE